MSLNQKDIQATTLNSAMNKKLLELVNPCMHSTPVDVNVYNDMDMLKGHGDGLTK